MADQAKQYQRKTFLLKQKGTMYCKQLTQITLGKWLPPIPNLEPLGDSTHVVFKLGNSISQAPKCSLASAVSCFCFSPDLTRLTDQIISDVCCLLHSLIHCISKEFCLYFSSRSS